MSERVMEPTMTPTEQVQRLFMARCTCLIAPEIISSANGREYALIVVKNIAYGEPIYRIMMLKLEEDSGFRTTTEPTNSYLPLGIIFCYLMTKLYKEARLISEETSEDSLIYMGTIINKVLEESFESENALLERYNEIVESIRDGANFVAI